MTNYFFSEDDISIEFKMLLITDFINLKIKFQKYLQK
jgi:hypothetical protein